MSGSTYTVTASDQFAFTVPASPELTALELQSRIRDMHARIIAMGQTTDAFAPILAKLQADVTNLTTEEAGVTAIQNAYNALVAQNANDASQLAALETSFSSALPALNQAVTANTPSAGTSAPAPIGSIAQLAAGATQPAVGAGAAASGSSSTSTTAQGAGGGVSANSGTGATTAGTSAADPTDVSSSN